MKKLYEIVGVHETKVLIEAEDRDHAYARYFYDCFAGKQPLDTIPFVIMLKDGKDEYPMRTGPLLWKMGFLKTDQAVKGISEIIGVSHNEAKKMLKQGAEQDARLIPLIEDIRLEEEGDTF